MKIRLVAVAVLALTAVSGPALAQNQQMVDQTFAILDADRDGTLSAEELRSMTGGDRNQDARVAMMMVMLDADGDGVLSKDEFAIMMSGNKAITDEQARRLFDHFDLDGSGGIDHLEGRSVMSSMQSGMSDEAMDAALGKADANGDGIVDFEEFRRGGM